MRFPTSAALGFVLVMASAPLPCRAADDYKPGPDSLPQAGVPKGELIKGQYTAKADSVFPGTERDYTVYLPPGLDKSKPSPFMVFQDGVIYQAPTVFDNLIARKEIPPLIGIFIRPGVVPAANPNALPRFNRSYEYDSVTDTYSRFLIDEVLPEIAKKHGLKLSEKGDDAAIAGNSSGGICAFMVAWHRPDRFRRLFTGVGTYVGIHGADQFPVLVRKMEPKPLRVYLQSGTGDNNLYCGDWWMANQMMERSLTWAGYEVNHTWGEGGHNAKHATAIFPEALKWLWRGWPEEGLRTNPTNTSKWKGYEVVKDGSRWETAFHSNGKDAYCLASSEDGTVATSGEKGEISLIKTGGDSVKLVSLNQSVYSISAVPNGSWLVGTAKDLIEGPALFLCKLGVSPRKIEFEGRSPGQIAVSKTGRAFIGVSGGLNPPSTRSPEKFPELGIILEQHHLPGQLCLSPDQTLLYGNDGGGTISASQIAPDGSIRFSQEFYLLETCNPNTDLFRRDGKMCVDTEGRLYVATSLGIQVCDQAGRVNFIIPTPQQPYDVCFGGKDLGELFITCGDKIYKRAMKTHGIVSGQMAPIKPAAPHL